MKQRKKWAYLIGALLISFALVSCGQKSLPDGFDGDEVLKSARGVVEQLSKKDYTGVVEQFSSVMEGLDEKTLSETMEQKLDDLGEFVSVSSEDLTGGSSEKTGDFATAVLVCEYQYGSATYTISFDKDGWICGLYVKDRKSVV